MLFIYRILINLIFLISPIIIIIRLLKKRRIFIASRKNSVFLQKIDVRVKLFGYMVLVLENFKVSYH